MKKVFVINGPPRSGKDTFVDCVHHFVLLESGKSRVKNVSSVDKIKKAAAILGWDGIKDETGRKFLSDLKDLSTCAYDASFKYMSDIVLKNENDILFFHIREPAEIKRFCLCFPETQTVFINRKTESFNNHADKNVDMYDYDYYIDNSSTLEEFVKNIRKWVYGLNLAEQELV